MKILTFALAFSALPLFAQTPPARDLNEAQRLLQEVQQQVAPLFVQLRQESEVLGIIAKAERELGEGSPRSAIDDALKMIAEYIEREESAGRPLTREMQHYLSTAREKLERARITAAEQEIATARRYLHDELVHPLQVRVGVNVTQLMAYQQMLQMLGQRAGAVMQTSVGAMQSGSRK
jgi:hypothetical protein